MNRKFLENLFSSIEDEDTKKNYVNAIMQEHGKDIEKKNTEIGTLKNDINVKQGVIDSLNTKVSDYEKQDIEAIKKEQYNLGKADGTKEVETFKKNSALEKALAKSKAKDSNLLAKLIDNEKLSFEEKDGVYTITGLDEQINSIKEDHAYLFEEKDDGQNVDLGGNHNGGNGDVDLDSMSYEEYKKWRENN